MAYNKTIWENLPSTNTPLNETNLNNMEDGIVPANTQIVTTANTDLNNYTTEGTYYFGSDYTPTNIPAGVNGWLKVMTTNGESIKQIFYRFGTPNANDYETYVRTYFGGTWSSWKQYQIVKETAWTNVTLNSGFTHGALASSGNLMYKRTGNIVSLKGSVSGFTALGQVCGTLPTGYRPLTRLDVYASYSGTKTANCTIGGNGNIALVNTQDGSISSNNWVAICATWVTDEAFPS